MKTLSALATTALLLLATHASGEEYAPGGEVRLPLPHYQALLQHSRGGEVRPARFALGKSTVQVQVVEEGERTTARVAVSLEVRTFDEAWTLVPLLPPGTAIDEASANGQPLGLVPTPDGLAGAFESAGRVNVSLRYTVDVARSEGGFSLAVALPRAPGELSATLPGSGLDVVVVPAAGVRVSPAGERTAVAASLPATSAIQITWRGAAAEEYSLSRARYQGKMAAGALLFRAVFGVEVHAASSVRLPLFPTSVTLSEVQVDGKPAPVLVDAPSGRFATVIRGRGTHEVLVSFQVPVLRGEGPPRASLNIPRVPLSRFEITLPGSKELSVSPESPVALSQAGGATVATLNVPMCDALSFSWIEAIPEEARAELSANASLVHLVHAEEGVLHVRAIATFEITRGETAELRLELPDGVQVNRVSAAQGGIVDWRTEPPAAGKPGRLTVFLDRKVQGEFPFEVHYERLLGSDKGEGPARITIPCLRAAGVHRQRGMIALLQSPELSLQPVEEPLDAKVGENQLPPAVREQIKLTVAHTYKYVDRPPLLVATAVAPERKAGSFDVQADTLVSIGELALKASSTLQVHLKAGSLLALDIELPEGVNLLGCNGPSLRLHEVRPGQGGEQTVHAEFTQEMDGDFALELLYERLLQAEGGGEVTVPVPRVAAAQVEHGRVAVEALAAVEVKPAAAEGVMAMDAAELPQQLILKTTNPILLAYKYARSEAPLRLALAVTRHRQVEVQAAAIDQASYRTLFLRDGLRVTAASLLVRNTSKQFLKLTLPAGSEVWSVLVAGRGQKPAVAGAEGEAAAKDEAHAGTGVLIPLIHSDQGFPIEIVYATPGAPLSFLGTLSATLPRSDMVVTRTQWDVFLPDRFRYGRLRTNLEAQVVGEMVDREAMAQSVGDAAARAAAPASTTLALSVPLSGVHFAFEKLYASESRDDARLSISYASRGGDRLAGALSLTGTLGLWAVALSGLVAAAPLPRRLAWLAAIASLALLLVAHGWIGTSPAPAAVVSALLAALYVFLRLRGRGLEWPGRRPPAPEPSQG